MPSILDDTYWKRAFIVYRKLGLLALKQQELKWTRPFLYAALVKYKMELKELLESILIPYYLRKNKTEQRAKALSAKLFSEGYFLEEMMAYVQTGELRVTTAWENDYLLPDRVVESIFFVSAKKLYERTFNSYYEAFGDIEGKWQDVLENFYIGNLLYNIDIEDLFCRCLMLGLYDKVVKTVDEKRNFESTEIPYPTFLLKKISRAKVTLDEQKEATEIESKQLILSFDLHDNAENLPEALSEYLFEYYRFHMDLSETRFKYKKEQIGERRGVVELIWIIESLIGNKTGLIRPDHLLSLFMALIYIDLISETNKQKIESSLQDVKNKLIELHRKAFLISKRIRCKIEIYELKNYNPDGEADFSGRLAFMRFNQNLYKSLTKVRVTDLMLKLEEITNSISGVDIQYIEDTEIKFSLSETVNAFLISETLTKEALQKRVNRNLDSQVKWIDKVLKI
ncbi:hypothetical protein EA770_18525 [Acinetobacter baumannii]|nr:hypothetical protein EA770_18525 [Acinetobacter baumannii]